MPDHSDLDTKYFVDDKVYNCPFCNRRHVTYSLTNVVVFDWSERKECKAFFVKCGSCSNRSMHLSFDGVSYERNSSSGLIFSALAGRDLNATLDDALFYSVPRSFFVLDERIPKILRELLTEAEGCLKSNYLTGASVCARKIVYELGSISSAAGSNYEERIKSLKDLHAEVDPAFFDTLLTIQQVTSTKVHENSYDGWEAKHLRVILASLAEVLHEIYVLPAKRADRRQAIIKLKEELTPKQ
jgi:hypothetical protein